MLEGELGVPGLSAPVVIRRDAWGVPHITAENEPDAIFALGFVQAQDRAGQLEILQRVIRGTLAELVGIAGLPVDRLTRRIGFRRAAFAQLDVLDSDVRQALDAFTAGINAGYEHGLRQWPHEFALLKSVPSPWEPVDVLTYVKFMSFQLPSNWDVEIARYLMLRQDGPEAVLALDPVERGLDLRGVSDAKPAGLTPMMLELQALEEFLPRGGGSNNWCVAGSRSASGQPLLASDPHLGPNIPNPWYLAHLSTPDWSVAGAAFAGTPVFPIAHNGHACWGVTAGLTDTTDLFIETLSADGRRTREPDGTWHDCELIRERIVVKGGEDVIEDIAVTPRGPIITPLIPGETHALSVKAVWLQPRKLRGFFEGTKARTFEDFRRPFAHWPVLPLNVLYADTGGTIGYQLIGDLPIRSGGSGLLPTPVARGDWSGFVPFDDMPHIANPECGFLATANDDPASWCPTRVELGHDFCDPYRAATIREELAKQSRWTAPDFQHLQLNLRSKPWEELRPILLALAPEENDARAALAELREWDGQVTADSPAAAVFEFFIALMSVRVAQAKARHCWRLAVGGDGQGPFGFSLLADRRVQHLVHLLQKQPPGWFDSWSNEISDALGVVIRTLRSEAGPAPPYWAWGHRRLLRLRHALLGRHWLFSRVFNLGPFPMPGDANTIQQAGVRPLKPNSETHNFPNLRTCFDTANWSNCRFALAGGQSGNPTSPHYDDQFPLWQRGEGIPMPWSEAEVLRAAKNTLMLRPA